MVRNKYSYRERSIWKSLLFGIIRYWWLLAIAAIVAGAAMLYRSIADDPPVKIEVVHDTRIDITPEEVRSIKEIGQWEFLSVATEEMVEWHRTRTFSTDHLVRIYRGTLRLGIDLTKASDDWFTSLPDSTAKLKLPKVGLLDENFIDEARTRSFYEKGSFPPEVLDQLYQKAKAKMKKRCLTAQNLQTTEKNARTQFTRIFKAFGFKKVEIEFTNAPQQK